MYNMLNFNEIERPLRRIVGGKYDKKVISVSDKFSSKDEDETDFSRSPTTPSSSKSQTPQKREK